MSTVAVREPEPLRTVLCSAPTAVTRAADDVHRIVEIEVCTQHVEVDPCPFHPDGQPVNVEHFVEGMREPKGTWNHDPGAFMGADWLGQFMNPGAGNSWGTNWGFPTDPPETGMRWG